MRPIKYVSIAVASLALLGFGIVIGYVASTSRPVAQQPAPVTPTAPEPPVQNPSGCIVGGCSRELCTDASQGPMMSPCIFRAEFACYKKAVCERQPDGACGWTPTAELTACLKNPPTAQ